MNVRATVMSFVASFIVAFMPSPLAAQASASRFTFVSVVKNPAYWNVVVGIVLALIALHAVLGRVRSRRLERQIDSITRESRAFYRVFPDHVFTITREGTFLSHRVPAVPGNGMPEAGIGGMRIVDVFGTESAMAVMDAVRKVLDTGDSFALEVMLDAAEGKRTYELRIVPFDRDQALFIARDVTERVAHEASLVSHLREKEILIREINHRVKNNLQVMSSLIALQTEFFKDEADKRLMEETQRRIHTMAYLHNLVYRSEDCSSIDLSAYLSEIAGSLKGAFGTRPEQIEVKLDAERILAPLATALPVGLIASELVSNSLKYAFPGSAMGVISVALHRDGDAIRLTVQDNGCGLPEGFSVAKSKSLGWILIQSLSRQIDATIDIIPGAGTGVALTFMPETPR